MWRETLREVAAYVGLRIEDVGRKLRLTATRVADEDERDDEPLPNPVVIMSDEAKRMVAQGMAPPPRAPQPPPEKPLAGSVKARLAEARRR